MFGGNVALFIVRSLQRVAPKVSQKVGGLFEFYPGINIEHKSKPAVCVDKPREIDLD